MKSADNLFDKHRMCPAMRHANGCAALARGFGQPIVTRKTAENETRRRPVKNQGLFKGPQTTSRNLWHCQIIGAVTHFAFDFRSGGR